MKDKEIKILNRSRRKSYGKKASTSSDLKLRGEGSSFGSPLDTPFVESKMFPAG